MKNLIAAVAALTLAVPFTANAQEAAASAPLPITAPGCSPTLKQRTPEQVIADHYAALGAGDLERAMCDYAVDARVIMPGSVGRGIDQIRAGFLGMAQMFGGAMPTINSITIDGEVVLLTYSIYTPTVSIPDGSDTFVIRNGLIYYQIVHSPLVFGAP